MKITHVSLYVPDQDEAVAWYSETLGFRKHADMPMGPNARWVTLSMPEYPEFEIVLEHESMANGPEMVEDIRSRVGKSSTMVFEVPDIRGKVAELKAKGVTFGMDLTDFPWGTQAMLMDPYGNKFVLSQAPEGGYPTGAER